METMPNRRMMMFRYHLPCNVSMRRRLLMLLLLVGLSLRDIGAAFVRPLLSSSPVLSKNADSTSTRPTKAQTSLPGLDYLTPRVHAKTTSLYAHKQPGRQRQEVPTKETSPVSSSIVNSFTSKVASVALATTISLAVWASPGSLIPNSPSSSVAWAADSAAIVTCLLSKCQLPFLQCITNPKCLANVICINTCNGRADETGCQIQCGNLFENDVVGEFNKCAVSDKNCVPQKSDTGDYPIPPPNVLVQDFKTSLFNGRWYISAGQNPLFDIFPCQVHFFTETSPGTFFGKLNWRVEEPDGEFFTRDALQRFVQDPKEPAHLLNHDNEYLHYQDDWYIVDYEYDNNKDGVPPFCFVYYRGSNDAWDGYGGAVVYTRDAALPKSLIPRLRLAAKRVNMNFDKDFTLTDNSCPPSLDANQVLSLREKFAGKVVLQTEEQIRAQATRVRGNAFNSVKAQKMFIEEELDQAERAFAELEEKAKEFEQDVVKNAEVVIVQPLEQETEELGEVAKKIEETIIRDAEQLLVQPPSSSPSSQPSTPSK